MPLEVITGNNSKLADDQVLPFSVEELDVRGRIVKLNKNFNALIARHKYPDEITILLGEAAILALMLAASVKLENKLILQAQGNGPVSFLVVDVMANGDFRATIKWDEQRLKAEGAELLGNRKTLLDEGTLAFTIDQGPYMRRYQGFVALEGEGLEGAAHNYFERSEQIPTKIRLAVSERIEKSDNGQPVRTWHASGMMMQFLPDASDRIIPQDLPAAGVVDAAYLQSLPSQDDAWEEAIALFSTLEASELADPEISGERLLYRLFHQHDTRIYDHWPVQEKCTCSEQKVREVLKSIGPRDLQENTIANNQIETKCEFCGRAYQFSLSDLN